MIFWMMPDNSAQTQAVMSVFLSGFKRENPDINVEVKVINRRTLWSEIFTLRHKNVAGLAPDLIAFPHYWTRILARANALENLTNLDKTLRVEDCLDPVRSHCYGPDEVDLYSYPWWLDITALHYREDHLKLISDEPQKLLSTWPGLLEACKKLKEHFSSTEGYFPIQNTDWRGSLSHRAVLPCIWGRGGYLVSSDQKRCGIGAAEFRQGMEDFISLAQKGYMPILRERNSLGTMSSGKASIMLTRRQGISMFEGAKKDLPVTTLPVPRTGASYVNYLSAVNLSVVRGSKCTQEALRLLKWLSAPQNQMHYASLTEVFPASEAAFENFLLSSPQRIRNYTNIIAGARTLPNHIVTGTIMEIMASIMSQAASSILKGKYSNELLAQILKDANDEAQMPLHLYGGSI
jgi:ABC-type glycerol-3-phosphate transport system substrate-binding protein